MAWIWICTLAIDFGIVGESGSGKTTVGALRSEDR